MLDKGLIVIGVIGAVFIYFAINMFNASSGDEAIDWGDSSKTHVYDAYYSKDVLGDDVLNLNSLSIDAAKNIWRQTPTKERIVSIIPDFDLAITEMNNALVDGKFKAFLVEYIERTRGKYLSGEIDSEGAKKAIANLK